jgi:hypothetical protein
VRFFTPKAYCHQPKPLKLRTKQSRLQVLDQPSNRNRHRARIVPGAELRHMITLFVVLPQSSFDPTVSTPPARHFQQRCHLIVIEASGAQFLC